MRSVFIIYTSYYDFEKQKPSIGGIQTYITELCNICHEIHVPVTVLQSGDKETTTCYHRTNITQFVVKFHFKRKI